MDDTYSFALKESPDVSFAMQDTNNVHAVFLQRVINSNRFESSDRPITKILNSRVAGGISRTHMRILA